MKGKSKRDREGKYTFEGKWDRLCVCGHRFGAHAAQAPHDCFISDYDGAECKCPKFKPAPQKNPGGRDPRAARDHEEAIEKYEEFQDRDYHRVGDFRTVTIPSSVQDIGEAKWVLYSSKKWTGKPANYIHDHDSGVRLCRPIPGGQRRQVPQWLRDVQTVAFLGDCLGLGYEDQDGDEGEAKVTRPYPGLYCTPNGEALLVIEGRGTDRPKLVALIWGGSLGVEDRGIVH